MSVIFSLSFIIVSYTFGSSCTETGWKSSTSLKVTFEQHNDMKHVYQSCVVGGGGNLLVVAAPPLTYTV